MDEQAYPKFYVKLDPFFPVISQAIQLLSGCDFRG